MKPRAYNPKTDEAAVIKLLEDKAEDISPGKDLLIVVESEDKIVSVLAVRPVVYVHDLVAASDSLAYRACELAFAYAGGVVKGIGNHQEAIFLVAHDNDKMRRFVEDHGATKENPSDVYTMEIK
jgi:hypothetical protein